VLVGILPRLRRAEPGRFMCRPCEFVLSVRETR
jgi:hypothetical protein